MLVENERYSATLGESEKKYCFEIKESEKANIIT